MPSTGHKLLTLFSLHFQSQVQCSLLPVKEWELSTLLAGWSQATAWKTKSTQKMARPEEDYGEAEAACIQGPLRIPQLSFLCTVFRVPQQMGRSSYCWRKLTKPPPLAPIKWHSHGAEPKIGPVCEDMAPPSPAQSPPLGEAVGMCQKMSCQLLLAFNSVVRKHSRFLELPIMHC